MQSSGMQLQHAGPTRAAAVGSRPTAVCLPRAHRAARLPVARVAAPEKHVAPSLSSSEDAAMTDTTGVLLVQCPGTLLSVSPESGTVQAHHCSQLHRMQHRSQLL